MQQPFKPCGDCRVWRATGPIPKHLVSINHLLTKTWKYGIQVLKKKKFSNNIQGNLLVKVQLAISDVLVFSRSGNE